MSIQLVYQPGNIKRNYVRKLKSALWLFNRKCKTSIELDFTCINENSVLCYDTTSNDMKLIISTELSINTQWFVDEHKWVKHILYYTQSEFTNSNMSKTLSIEELHDLLNSNKT